MILLAIFAAIAMILAATGLAALAREQLINNRLYRVQGKDPAALATVAVLLFAAALTAAYIAARRALAVEPMAHEAGDRTT
jgi:hypothetical protein